MVLFGSKLQNYMTDYWEGADPKNREQLESVEELITSSLEKIEKEIPKTKDYENQKELYNNLAALLIKRFGLKSNILDSQEKSFRQKGTQIDDWQNRIRYSRATILRELKEDLAESALLIESLINAGGE